MRRCDLFRPSDFRWLPAIELVGTVEGKYPERAAAAHGHDPKTTLVRGSMAKKMYYCFEDQSLEEAREIMRRHQSIPHAGR